jgi:hypothetical protein
VLVVESNPLREPQRDHALTQHVLHRLPEAKVDAERKRSDELGQPHAHGLPQFALRHARTLRPDRSGGKAELGWRLPSLVDSSFGRRAHCTRHVQRFNVTTSHRLG